MDRNKLYADLARDEDERLTPYRDSKGLWTIGIGHLIDEGLGPNAPPRISRITKAESRAFFDADVAWAIALAKELFPQWSDIGGSGWLDDVRQRALVNMAFNRGETKMRNSSTITPAIRAALQKYDYVAEAPALWFAVSTAILNSPWCKEIKNRGKRLAFMLETGRDPV